MTRLTGSRTDQTRLENADARASKTRANVWIRSTQTVHELFLQKPIALSATEQGEAITLELRPPIPEEEKKGVRRWDSVCVATFTPGPPASVVAILESLTVGRMPPRSTRDPEKYPDIPDSGEIPPGLSAPAELLPEFFREWIRKVHRQLHGAKIRTVNVVRWRAALEGPHNPLQSAGSVEWSLDGEHWRGMPGSISARLGAVSGLTLNPATLAVLEDAIQEGHDEPLGHQLHREAWGQFRSNPRSALVIGIAAAEIGFKRLVADLLPGAGWLIEHVPSPPLVSMLTDYMPILPVRLKLHDQVVISPWIVGILKKGVRLRNELAHQGRAPRGDTVEEVLSAVKDLLWLLDYYAGHEWALAHLSNKSRAELGLPEGYTKWWELDEEE
jgi:hypothetical protein